MDQILNSTLFQNIQRQIDQLGYITVRDVTGATNPEQLTAPVPVRDESEWYENVMSVSQDRIARYGDFEDMDTHPLMASILDIYSQESTRKDAWGNIVRINTNNSKVKQDLEELLFKRLNINFRGKGIIRDMCKYGDKFQFLVLQKDRKGVLYLKDMPAWTVFRLEQHDKLVGFVQYQPSGMSPVLDPFSVVHWRLGLTKERYRPYGTSLFEPTRRHYRQMKLMEDAMTVYRITRAPERRMFFISVGRLGPAQADQYIQKIVNKWKKQPMVNQKTNEIDWKSHTMCITLDTKIPLLDGREITLQQAIEEYQSGKENWAYAVDRKTGEVKPGKISNAAATRLNAEIVRVTLDNGESITCTPDHKFIMRDLSKTQAQDLNPGDSIFPLYRKVVENAGSMNGYEMVFAPNNKIMGRKRYKSGDYVFTHMISGEYKYGPLLPYPQYNLHHADENKLNNNPENILQITVEKHGTNHNQFAKMNSEQWHKDLVSETNRKYDKARKMGEAYNGSDLHKEHNAIRSEALKKTWAEKGDSIKRKATLKFDDVVWGYIVDLINKNPKINRETIIDKLNTEMREHLLEINPEYRKANREKILSVMVLKTRMKEIGYQGLTEFKKDKITNHKVVSVEWLEERQDTGSLTVDEFHNYAVSCGIYIGNSPDEDFYIPVRDGQDGTRIEQLPGGQNLSEIDDVRWFKDQILAYVKIPRVYLNDPEGGASERRENLAQQDVRFAAAIDDVQEYFLESLTKICVIHLLLRGYTKAEALDFTLQSTQSSYAAEQLRMEVEMSRLSLVGTMVDAGLPKTYAMFKVLQLPKAEINKLSRMRRGEDLLMARREAEVNAFRTVMGDALETSMKQYIEKNGVFDPKLSFLNNLPKPDFEEFDTPDTGDPEKDKLIAMDRARKAKDDEKKWKDFDGAKEPYRSDGKNDDKSHFQMPKHEFKKVAEGIDGLEDVISLLSEDNSSGGMKYAANIDIFIGGETTPLSIDNYKLVSDAEGDTYTGYIDGIDESYNKFRDMQEMRYEELRLKLTVEDK